MSRCRKQKGCGYSEQVQGAGGGVVTVSRCRVQEGVWLQLILGSIPLFEVPKHS